jgi:hypothetical protein
MRCNKSVNKLLFSLIKTFLVPVHWFISDFSFFVEEFFSWHSLTVNLCYIFICCELCTMWQATSFFKGLQNLR